MHKHAYTEGITSYIGDVAAYLYVTPLQLELNFFFICNDNKML